MATDVINIGILGAANIARPFTTAVRSSGRVKVRAVASRNADKGRAFAHALDIPVVHGSYDDLLADPSIDAIYNPLPNNLHAEWSVRALEARKHVLCEKPLCLTSRDAATMFEAAERHGVYLVEGYPYRCQPQTLKLAELLKEGAIGALQTVQASFGFMMTDTENIRFNPALGGGALLDAGSYPVSMIRLVAGERALKAHAFAKWSATGVEQSLIGSIEHPSGLLAQFSCSFSTVRHRRVVIVGDKGTITSTYFNDTNADMLPHVDITRGIGWDASREVIVSDAAVGFLAEAEAFADLIERGWPAWPGPTPSESKDIIRTLEALTESARGERVVSID